MKLFKLITYVLLSVLMLVGCAPNVTTSPQPSIDPSEEPAETVVDMYADGTGMDLLVGVDEFGRVLSPKTSDREDKQIGMFYWLWHGSYVNRVIDTTKIIEQYGLDYALHNVDEYNPTMQPHYWGEPLYGYYSSTDEYVLRKHMEMLSYAGVDFIMFDASNTLTYPVVVRKLCNIIIELQQEGFNPPKIAYFTHTASIQTVLQAYNEIYSKDQYRDAWYFYDGKPLMIAQTDPAKDRERTRNQHAHLASYDPDPLPQEILDFFTFREPNWVGMGDPVNGNTWPWIDWNYPPQTYGNLICVSPATHHYAMFSWAAMDEDERPSAVWSGNNVSWGRGYNIVTQKNVSEDATKGTFYQSVWDYTYQKDPDIVYLSGWNEWECGVGYNSEYDVYEMYDSFNMEFSRDLEPMKGGYNDAFLMQTAINARRYLTLTEKEAEGLEIKTPVKKTVDINGDIAQWDGIDAVYRFFGSENYGRSAVGATKDIRYKMDAAKNAIQTVKVTADKDNIYMLITSSNDITLTAENSMNVFIGTGTPELKGWEGYEYVINRERTANTASIMKLDQSGNATAIGNAQIKVSGMTMQLAIPKSALNMQSDTFYFKVADSVENLTDIMDYYVTGRSMPMGRFSYQYLG